MLLERAELTIRPGHEEAFAESMREHGLPLLTSVPGVKWAKLGRGVENPEKFMILAEWESMEAHAAFPTLPVYPEFGALFAPHSVGGAMEHFKFD